jgi:AcrR family transcriptional regulator
MALNRREWVEAGLKTLASEGIEAVRVEVLARELGVSKGSFYWHFKNRDELLQAMLGEWETQETDWFLDEVERGLSTARRWTRLLELASGSARRIPDTAIFAWARREPQVAARVNVVEQKRMDYIGRVLRETGFGRVEAAWWSETVYLAFLGLVDRASRDPRFRKNRAALSEYLSRLVLSAAALQGEERGSLLGD